MSFFMHQQYISIRSNEAKILLRVTKIFTFGLPPFMWCMVWESYIPNKIYEFCRIPCHLMTISITVNTIKRNSASLIEKLFLFFTPHED